MTDHGSQLDSKKLSKWMQAKRIEHLFSAVYHHQTNGVVERFNRTLEGRLRTAQNGINQWDEVIEKSLFAYRTTQHSVTKRSPFEIIYGANPRLEIDAKLELDAPKLVENHQTILQEARDTIQTTANKKKEQYDCKERTKWRDLNNRLVYWKVPPRKDGKLADRFKGPFLAKQTDSRWNFKIVDKDGNHKIVHVNHLKECTDTNLALAGGLRGRGRPRLTRTIWSNTSNRRSGGEV